MRSVFVSLLGGLFATSLVGQSQNPFIIAPQDPVRDVITSSPFVGRPDWNRDAEGLIEINKDFFRGVGDEGGTCMVYGMYHWAADEDIRTSETYDVILRSADTMGLPNNTPAGEILRVPNLTTPNNPGAVPPNIRASRIVIDVFATPVAVPCDQTWFQGIHFPANPSWPVISGTNPQVGDGHSLWRFDTLNSMSNATVGENGRVGHPEVAWAVTPAASIFTTEWTYILGALVDMPVLNLGGIDPNSTRVNPAQPGLPSYGLNGMYPDISGTPRSDGLNMRINDVRVPQGVAIGLASFGWGPLPLPLGVAQGRVHIDLINSVVVGIGIMNNGTTTIPVAVPGSLGTNLQGSFVQFQGGVIDPVTRQAWITNSQATSL